jgi:hypothetical protein
MTANSAVAGNSPAAQDAAAQPRVTQTMAVWHIDPLGMSKEIVTRLESLFRTEIERLAGKPLPSHREMDERTPARWRRSCTGETRCLAQIGKALGVEWIISGNVAALADSYIFNLKLVDVASAAELRRIASDPLRGNPDELIESVRLAAYRLVAPDYLLGSIAILTDLVGADVVLDGKKVGTTPLPRPIDSVPLGKHALKVTAPNYSPFEEQVEVRFQKTSRVVVRLALAAQAGSGAAVSQLGAEAPAQRKRWYNSTWFYVAAGVGAAIVGGVIGYQLAHDEVIDCSATPSACN